MPMSATITIGKPDTFAGATAAGAGNGAVAVAKSPVLQLAPPIKRSKAYPVQRLCVLAVTGPGFRGAVKTGNFAAEKLVLKNFDLWEKEMDTHPDLEERALPPKDSWLSENKALEVYTATGVHVTPAPTITLSSTDPVHVTKALCVIASAYQCRNTSSIVCGAPATLSRKRLMWFNGVLSARNGDVWYDSLALAAFPTDTLVLEMHADDKDGADGKLAFAPVTDDVTPWLPVAAWAKTKGAADADAVVKVLQKAFPGMEWSLPMMRTCMRMLKGF